MTNRFWIPAVLLLFTNTITAQDQPDELPLQELDEVVVTDSRFELKRENSGKTVIKISQEELQLNQGRTIAEIINLKSGIEIAGSRGRFGEVLGVFARGGRGRQVLVIIDGVRVSDPSSFSQEYDLRLLNPTQVESIEIIKGAASTLYGTNAATAVINISTKAAPDAGFSADLQSSVGSNQTADDQNFNLSEFNNSARIAGSSGKLNYSVAFAHTFVNGISSIETETDEEDSSSRYSLDAQLGYKVGKDLSLKIYANQTKLSTDYDESFGLIDAPYQFMSEQKRAGLSGGWSLKHGEIGLNTAITEFDSENISAFPNSFTGRNWVADLFGKYVFDDKFYTILGLNYIKDQADFTEKEEFTLIDPYFNLVYVSDMGLNINAGLRLNQHSEYGSQMVYNLNPSYSFTLEEGYLKLMATFATSYITPSLTQLFGEFGANPDLEPETNRTIEGGVEYSITNNLRTSLVYFNRKEENFVFFDNILFQYLNAENTIDAQGLEFEIDWSPLKKLGFSGNYTFTERSGDTAIRIPRHKVNSSISYQFTSKMNAVFNMSYTGKRSDTDFNTFSNVELDPFTLVGLVWQYQLVPDKFRIFLNLDNLLNTEYTEVVGFNTRGRNFRLGIALNL